MATQTGSIDLTASNGVKLYAEAGFTNAEQTYSTKTELTAMADGIRSEVSETYATQSYVTSEIAQTSTAFEITFSTYDSALAELSDTVDGMPTAEDFAALENTFVLATDARLAWLNVTTDAQARPVLSLGTSNSEYVAEFNNENLIFKSGDRELATLGGIDGLHAPSIATDESVSFNDWIWERRSNGHLTLKYIGGDT